MTTDEILNIDCRDADNKNKLNKFLWKVKAVQSLEKRGIKKDEMLTVDNIEKVLHGICIKYDFTIQNISPYYEENKLKFYLASLKHGSTWIGNVYGLSMWEVLAKSIIKIYSEILKERNKQK